jgi:hypothetical protein
MNKAWVIGLATLSVILAIISVTLAIMLYHQRRFVPAKGNSPYIMFDTRTAQACWSGPPLKPTSDDDLVKKFGAKPVASIPESPNDLPFCKDLKGK